MSQSPLIFRKRAPKFAVSPKNSLAVNPDAVIENLSVGQQQRVELLKALYRHASLLP